MGNQLCIHYLSACDSNDCFSDIVSPREPSFIRRGCIWAVHSQMDPIMQCILFACWRLDLTYFYKLTFLLVLIMLMIAFRWNVFVFAYNKYKTIDVCVCRYSVCCDRCHNHAPNTVFKIWSWAHFYFSLYLHTFYNIHFNVLTKGQYQVIQSSIEVKSHWC